MPAKASAEAVELFQQVEEVLDEASDPIAEGNLIGLLKTIQNEIGYLPEAAIQAVAERMDIPMSRVYGVATFYSLFSTEKRGRYVIRVCESAPCYILGSDNILAAIQDQLGIEVGETTPDELFTLEFTSCLGVCGVAPAVMINDTVHGNLTEDSIREVLSEYRERD